MIFHDLRPGKFPFFKTISESKWKLLSTFLHTFLIMHVVVKLILLLKLTIQSYVFRIVLT